LSYTEDDMRSYSDPPCSETRSVSEPARTSDSVIRVERRELPRDIQEAVQRNLNLGRSLRTKQSKTTKGK